MKYPLQEAGLRYDQNRKRELTMYKLTKEQKVCLDSLVCQRISEDDENKQVIQKFKNSRNPGIPYALKKGWNADKKDKVAYYIVKDPKDKEPLLFFSLKCGEIHIPISPEKLEKNVENNMALLDAACGREAPDWAREIIEKRKVNGVLPFEKFMEIYESYSRSLNKRNGYKMETQLEGDNIIRTKKNFAGVELVHFCVHEPAKEKWKAMGMGAQSLGKTIFWHFVVPVIQEIRKLVGCEYLYLFAADEKRDGTLTGYYQQLGFAFRDDINVNKPAYDFCCFFMCQEVTSLRNRQRDFFKNYNKPRESDAA